jgi:predicted alpha/beta-fold hydrolase
MYIQYDKKKISRKILNVCSLISEKVYVIFIYMFWFFLRIIFEFFTGLFTRKEVIPTSYHLPSSMNYVVKKGMKDVLQPFKLAPWANGKYIQTLIAAFYGRFKKFHKYTRREYVKMNDGVLCLLDWKEPPYHKDDMIIVVCPGLACTSESYSIQWMTDLIYKTGWKAVVYNRRWHLNTKGCEEHLDKNSKLYPMHADLDDMDVVCQYIRKCYPKAKMGVVGFSCGANLAVKYIGDHSTTQPFQFAIAVCNGNHIPILMNHWDKHTSLAGSLILWSLKRLLRVNINRLNKDGAYTSIIDYEKLKKEDNVRAFEKRLMLPLYKEYKTIEQYHEHNSSYYSMRKVYIPMLTLDSWDDPLYPVCVVNNIKAASMMNNNIFSVITDRGGHLGWISGWWGHWWMMEAIMEYIHIIRWYL